MEAVVKKLQIVERIMRGMYTMPNLEQLFECLTYTKAGLFPANKNTILYRPNLREGVMYQEYYSSSEVVIQLTTYKPDLFECRIKHIDKDSCKNFVGKIAEIEINGAADLSGRVGAVENIIDENGVFHRPSTDTVGTRNSYLKASDLVPGTSYLDAKGVEWLYIGWINLLSCCGSDGVENRRIYQYQGHLKVTGPLKKKLQSGQNINGIIGEIYKSDSDKGTLGASFKKNKKFTQVQTVYLQPSAIVFNNTVRFGTVDHKQLYIRREIFISPTEVTYQQTEYKVKI
jgi:hypothetical protein